MSSPMYTTAKQIWSKLANKEYRDSFVASNISNTVSSQIFTLRDQRGWTQKELAQRAGMGQSRIPALEDPNIENFEIGTLKRIASAFDVALVVRFVPFSDLANWTADLSEEKLSVPEFANDRLVPVSANSTTIQIVTINSRPLNAAIGPIGAGNFAGTVGVGGGYTGTSAHMSTSALTISGVGGGVTYQQTSGPNLNASTGNFMVLVPHHGNHANG
jgi:transcriptional regulator with XRE-family HTH domain